MTKSWIHIGLPSTIWLASLGVISVEYISPLSFGPIGGLSWLVFIGGVLHFLLVILS